jgi:hypothetical protein
MVLTVPQRNPKYVAAQKTQLAKSPGASYDVGNPSKPVGHAAGVRIVSHITSDFRQTWRPRSMNVTVQQVVVAITQGGVKNWVLMGLYGYSGYLAQPRATQDVDIMVDHEESEAAVQALLSRWPELEVQDQSPVVIRFLDPGETHAGQAPQVVIDVMLPNDACQREILLTQVVVDPETGHRKPSLEAALASKYSAIVSPFRSWNRKQQDVVDFRSIVSPDHEGIDRKTAFQLGELIFEGGGDELLEFIQLAIDNKPFPV